MPSGPLNSLWMFAPTVIMVGAVWLWRLQISRERKRRPFEGKLLRPPGEFLRRRLEEIDEQLTTQSFFVILLSSFLPATISSWPNHDSLFVQAAAVILPTRTPPTIWIWIRSECLPGSWQGHLAPHLARGGTSATLPAWLT